MTQPATKETITPGRDAVPEHQASHLQSLRELRASVNVIYARNISDKPISCRERNGAINVDFMLERDELAIIPKEALYVKGFLKCWQRGELKISDDESMENELLLDLEGHVRTEKARVQAIMDTMQPAAANNDIQPLECVIGGEPVLQRVQASKDGEPPLCDRHKNMAHTVVRSQQPDGSWTFEKTTGVSR